MLTNHADLPPQRGDAPRAGIGTVRACRSAAHERSAGREHLVRLGPGLEIREDHGQVPQKGRWLLRPALRGTVKWREFATGSICPAPGVTEKPRPGAKVVPAPELSRNERFPKAFRCASDRSRRPLPPAGPIKVVVLNAADQAMLGLSVCAA